MVNTEEEDLYILWVTLEISIKFSGKMWFIIILKVSEKQGFTFSLENAFLEKPQGGGRRGMGGGGLGSNWLSKSF